MTSARAFELVAGTASAFEMHAGQKLEISAQSGVGLVAFNAHDLAERFDQARTKVYNMKLWLELGDKLFSKLNNPMMVVVEDGFRPYGRHDLQLGFCAGHSEAAAACLANLEDVLIPWKIAAHSIPMALNGFQTCEVDVVSGAIKPVPVRLPSPVRLVLKAEIDLVVALSACPAAAGAEVLPAHISIE